MTQETITVCSCTLGPSAKRLRTFLAELRQFTKQSFRHVVVDDGTKSHTLTAQQCAECDRAGAEWYANPGPTFGISYAWNYALDQVKTPWAFCIEDGLRPSMGWLETAMDFVDQIGSRTWGPPISAPSCGPHHRQVGMAGFAHLQDWMLALGDAWPGGRDVMDVFRGNCQDFFERPGWNDGYWCWNRMLPGMRRSIEGDTKHWESDVLIFKQLATEGVQAIMDRHPCDVEQAWQKWRMTDHWPARRQAWCGWYPGAFMLVNMDAWRTVGKFRDGCTFFEGHLGVRMGMAGYLSLCVEGPPWLHAPSLGFKASQYGKTPRHHEDTRKVFMEDFAQDNMDAPNKLSSAVVTIEEQIEINRELAGVELAMVPGWEKWL